MKGPIELRDAKDLFVVSLQSPGIGVDAILEKLAKNKVKCTIYKSEEGNRYDQNMVVWLIYIVSYFRF